MGPFGRLHGATGRPGQPPGHALNGAIDEMMRAAECMNRVCRLAASVTILVVAPSAAAGGDAWPVRVLSLEQGGFSRFSMQLEVVATEPGSEATLFGCQRLVIEGRFSRPSLLRGHPAGVTREGHRVAIERLRQAQIGASIVRFGVLGTGLVPKAGAPDCVFRSRGLHVWPLPEGPVVLSVHNPV